jgi:hypothetical protein
VGQEAGLGREFTSEGREARRHGLALAVGLKTLPFDANDPTIKGRL